jgi:hypothetical protein
MHVPFSFLAQPLFNVPHSEHIWACFGLQVALRQSYFFIPCAHTSTPPSSRQFLAKVLGGHLPHVQYLFRPASAVSVATRVRFCTIRRVNALETDGAQGV